MRMRLRLQRAAALLAVGVALAILPASTRAGLTVTQFTGDANFTSISAGFSKVAGATTRIGNNGPSGDWELGIVDPNDSPFTTGAQANFVLGEGEEYDFTLTLNGTSGTLTYEFGGTTLTYSSIATAGLNDLYVRARGTAADSVQITDLTLNNSALSIDEVAAQGDGGPNAGYLRISGSDLADGFTLSGKMTFTWTGSPPTGSNLIGQFKLGTNPNVAAVPEPSTIALAATALVPMGVVAMRRSRRRSAIGV